MIDAKENGRPANGPRSEFLITKQEMEEIDELLRTTQNRSFASSLLRVNRRAWLAQAGPVETLAWSAPWAQLAQLDLQPVWNFPEMIRELRPDKFNSYLTITWW